MELEIHLAYPMFERLRERLRERRYQKGCHDRDAGRLPERQDSAYLEGYLKGRPEGFDSILQYFPSVEMYLDWKSHL